MPVARKVEPKSYILLGTDEYAKPRGARFSGDADPELLATAAEDMHLWLIAVTNDDLAELADRLPAGRLHARSGGLVPYIKGELYSELLGTALDEEPWPPADPGAPAELPHNWDEVAPGHVVIARESFECGWWEAVVIERNGDLLTLKHRDYPCIPKMVRHRSAVALISAPAP